MTEWDWWEGAPSDADEIELTSEGGRWAEVFAWFDPEENLEVDEDGKLIRHWVFAGSRLAATEGR